MVLKVFTVYDSKAEAFLRPFFMRSQGEAIRAFSELVNDGKSEFSKYPGDYTLFWISEYNEEDGTFNNTMTKQNLGTALEHKHAPTLVKEA